MIILVSGRAGEGKSTFANYCIKYLNKADYRAKTYPFAKGVKDTARFMGWNNEKDESGRQLLQEIGNTGRNYNENTWANFNIDSILDDMDYLQGGKNWFAFVDDWRFRNEGVVLAEKIQPVLTVRVIRPKEFHTLIDSPLYDDISEVSLPNPEDELDFYNVLVYNSTTLDELENTAKQFVERNLVGGK